MPRTHRKFPPEFKAQVVLQLIRGEVSPAELCREHNISAQLLAYWKETVLERLPTLFENDGDSRQNRDRVRIAELEQLVGKQAYELDILPLNASNSFFNFSPDFFASFLSQSS